MKLFGNKSEFAIRVEVSNPAPPWIFGQVCFLVNDGTVIGDWEECDALWTAFGGFSRMVRFHDRRKSERLFQMPSHDLHHLMQPRSSLATSCLRISAPPTWTWGHLTSVPNLVSPLTDGASCSCSILDLERLVFGRTNQHPNVAMSEVFLKAGTADRVLRQFCESMEAEFGPVIDANIKSR